MICLVTTAKQRESHKQHKTTRVKTTTPHICHQTNNYLACFFLACFSSVFSFLRFSNYHDLFFFFLMFLIVSRGSLFLFAFAVFPCNKQKHSRHNSHVGKELDNQTTWSCFGRSGFNTAGTDLDFNFELEFNTWPQSPGSSLRRLRIKFAPCQAPYTAPFWLVKLLARLIVKLLMKLLLLVKLLIVLAKFLTTKAHCKEEAPSKAPHSFLSISF